MRPSQKAAADSGGHCTVNDNSDTVDITCCSADRIADFMETDLAAVVELVLKDPARFQLAMLDGKLHQLLCKETHFGSIPQNRNVVSVQQHGTTMRVRDGGKNVAMSKKSGIEQIIANSIAIAEDDQVRRYLGEHTMKDSPKQRNEVGTVIQNKGEFVRGAASRSNTPKTAAPERRDQASVWAELKMALRLAHTNDERGVLIPLCEESFAHRVMFFGNQWWEATDTPGAWACCDDGPEVVAASIRQLFVDLEVDIDRRLNDAPDGKDCHSHRVKDALAWVDAHCMSQMVMWSIVTR
jgi:hypothetical protein